MDKALLRNVRREVKEIEKKIEGSPDPDTILDLSRSLRHLLIDQGNGLLKKTWNEVKVRFDLPQELMIRARNLNRVLDLPHFQDGRGTYADASDVSGANGTRALGGFVTQGVVSDEDLRKQAYAAEPIDFKISKYRSSACLILGSQPISRENVIKYVANKLGANHYDKTRNDQKKETEAYLLLDRCFDFYGDNPQSHNLAVTFGENGNALHAAILGICRNLLNSPDVQKLVVIIDANIQAPPNLGFK